MSDHNIWQGQRVRLRAIEPEDWPIYDEWNLDSNVARDCYWVPFPKSREATKKWVNDSALELPKNDAFNLAIENLAGELVGNINTHSCDPRNGTFKYGLAIRREHWRKGYAVEAIQLVLRYFFQELRYQKVTVEIYAFNEASIKLHEQLGFVHEGCMRRMYFTNGKYYDSLIFGMTAEEFTSAPHAL